ncbi:MAG: B12-binding domain-containing radical SAM protein, partial [Candidatus Omnitrophica bacterium]|nr:B12-binding domain-containing radical SAM protein [Candidatus Omnitrophota bacterium]
RVGYKATHATGKRTAFVLTSRGCPFRCIFCHNIWADMPMRFILPERILEEIKYLVCDYQIQHVGLVDNDFFLNRNRARSFCELMIQKNPGVKWSTTARPDSLDEEIISFAARAGCTRIGLGFESGSQRILDLLEKRLNVQKNLEIARLCHKYNIEVAGLFVVGNPTETKEDIYLTWDFIKKAHLDTIRITVATPFPGTRLWKWCQERGYISPYLDFSDLYVTHGNIQIPDTFTPREVENVKKKLLIKAHLFNPKLRKNVFLRFCHDPVHMVRLICNSIPKFKIGFSQT